MERRTTNKFLKIKLNFFNWKIEIEFFNKKTSSQMHFALLQTQLQA
jgi:hypothetical protein